MRELPPSGAQERDRDFAINELIRGKGNFFGEVTLRANQTTTTITGRNITADGVPLLFPTTSNAAAALATTYGSVVAGTVTLTHANNAQTDRTFLYVVIGG